MKMSKMLSEMHWMQLEHPIYLFIEWCILSLLIFHQLLLSYIPQIFMWLLPSDGCHGNEAWHKHWQTKSLTCVGYYIVQI